jgi:hypothetical protein
MTHPAVDRDHDHLGAQKQFRQDHTAETVLSPAAASQKRSERTVRLSQRVQSVHTPRYQAALHCVNAGQQLA